jgi:hypothetical protein
MGEIDTRGEINEIRDKNTPSHVINGLFRFYSSTLFKFNHFWVKDGNDSTNEVGVVCSQWWVV